MNRVFVTLAASSLVLAIGCGRKVLPGDPAAVVKSSVFAPEGGGFRVAFPGKPKTTSQNMSDAGYRMSAAYLPVSGGALGVIWVESPPGTEFTDDEIMTAFGSGSGEITSRSDHQVAGRKGSEMWITFEKTRHVHALVLAVPGRLYILFEENPASSGYEAWGSADFMGSFELVP